MYKQPQSEGTVLPMDSGALCSVILDGERVKSGEFVAVLTDEETKEAKLYYAADPLLVGMAVQMLQRVFTMMMLDLPPEDCAAVTAILCGEEPPNDGPEEGAT